MSEQQNTKVVQDAYAAFGRGDIESLINSLADDVEWIVPGEGLIPQAGTYRGKEELRGFFSKLPETIDFEKFEPRTFVAQGENVVALGSYSGKAQPGGAPFAAEWAMVFGLRGGQIARFREYTDTASIASAYARGKAA